MQAEEVDETVVNYESDPEKEIYWEVVEANRNLKRKFTGKAYHRLRK